MDDDPIKQLQSLLDDRSKLLEKISSIHSVLGTLRPAEPSAPEPVLPRVVEPAAAQSASDFAYGRLQQALQDMQRHIEQRVQPVARQVVDSEVVRLRQQSDYDQAALKTCLAEIDRCILTCIERMEEYQKRHSVLTALNQRLAGLGAPAEPIAQNFPATSLADLIQARLVYLSEQTKL